MTTPPALAPLRILLSNDDGVFADGLQALAAEAHRRGHRVTVVCPDQERSATGHGLTLQTPIRAERADELFAEGVTAWACSGTPADCVKLALFRLLEEPPDLVLSGINHGPNLGTDVLYSGTVAAAMEGTIEGVPSMAVSAADFRCREFQPSAGLALEVAEALLVKGWPEGLLLNLNVPPVPRESMGPSAGVARQCVVMPTSSIDGWIPAVAPTTGWRGRWSMIWRPGWRARWNGPPMRPGSRPMAPASPPCSRSCSGEGCAVNCPRSRGDQVRRWIRCSNQREKKSPIR